VYTIIDEEKKKNYLTNCELGYYDQFSRLQWVEKQDKERFDEPIIFDFKTALSTDKLLLRIKGGKNIVTEIALLSDKEPNDKK